jgi:hypothetical protein
MFLFLLKRFNPHPSRRKGASSLYDRRNRYPWKEGCVEKWICVTCGTHYPASQRAPERCPICDDDRQYVGRSGQQWTTLEQLCAGHRNTFHEIDPGITTILTKPGFAIGQRAHLVQTAAGNVLWDCIALMTPP